MWCLPSQIIEEQISSVCSLLPIPIEKTNIIIFRWSVYFKILKSILLQWRFWFDILSRWMVEGISSLALPRVLRTVPMVQRRLEHLYNSSERDSSWSGLTGSMWSRSAVENDPVCLEQSYHTWHTNARVEWFSAWFSGLTRVFHFSVQCNQQLGSLL